MPYYQLGTVYIRKVVPRRRNISSSRVTRSETTFHVILHKNAANRLHGVPLRRVVSGARKNSAIRGDISLLPGTFFSILTVCPFLTGQNHRDNPVRHESAVVLHFKVAAARWSWSNEMIEALINAIKEYRNLCVFNTIDFNADKGKEDQFGPAGKRCSRLSR